MRTAQLHKQGTDDDIGLAWHMRQVGPIRTFGHGGTLGGHILLLEIVPERNFAIAILTNSSAGWRLIQDVEREALKSYFGAAYSANQAIAHRGLLETLPSAEPLARQPDPEPYLGTYASEQFRTSSAPKGESCSSRIARRAAAFPRVAGDLLRSRSTRRHRRAGQRPVD